jgi:hypothetical protein
LSRKEGIFFPDSNITLYDKHSESDYFYFLHQKQNFFFNIFFRKKTYPPPPPFKLNGRSLTFENPFNISIKILMEFSYPLKNAPAYSFKIYQAVFLTRDGQHNLSLLREVCVKFPYIALSFYYNCQNTRHSY